jgi:hypothetical protein
MEVATMAWRKIRQYSFVWIQASNRFNLDLWLTPPNGPDSRVVDHRFLNLGPEEFEGICVMLNVDRDGQLFCDPQTNQISTGVDLL